MVIMNRFALLGICLVFIGSAQRAVDAQPITPPMPMVDPLGKQLHPSPERGSMRALLPTESLPWERRARYVRNAASLLDTLVVRPRQVGDDNGSLWARALGFPEAALRRTDYRLLATSEHETYQQFAGRLPVWRAQARLSYDRHGRPTRLKSTLVDPAILANLPSEANEGLGIDEVVRAMKETLSEKERTLVEATPTPDEVVYATADQAVRAWRVTFVGPHVERTFIVSRQTGAVLYQEDPRLYHSDRPAPAPESTGQSPTSPLSATDGTGNVYAYDPLASADAAYGGALSDNNDANNPTLESYLIRGRLPELTQGTDGLFRLESRLLKIVGGPTGGSTYTPPRGADPNADFTFVRSDEHFEAVNAYYHIAHSELQLLSLGFPPRSLGPIKVHPRGATGDVSYYTPSQDQIVFGLGGVDDAEDAGVVWHEHGHSILEAIVPNIASGNEGAALHEGWSDYWAASQYRALLADGQIARSDWQTMFKWDTGDGAIWPGRSLTSTATYPGDTTCDSLQPNNQACDIYTDGVVWATTLMEVFDQVGKQDTDALVVQSHFYLQAPITFREAAEAMLQADQDLFEGRYASDLINVLGGRGYLDVSVLKPILVHTPLSASEDTNGSRTISLTARAASGADLLVQLHASTLSEPAILVERPDEPDTYSGAIPLPGTAAMVNYYLEATDLSSGVSARLPAEGSFQFYAGVDTAPPSFLHQPIASGSSLLWPRPIAVDVYDNVGVDSVAVAWEVRDASGVAVASGVNRLSPKNGVYAGFMGASTPADTPQRGTQIAYRFVATDVAPNPNSSVFPGDNQWLVFTLDGESTLERFDVPTLNHSLVAEGVWEYDRPSYGTFVTFDDRPVWVTKADGSYPASPSLSTLELPALNLSGRSLTFLSFRHYYDIEWNPSDELYWDGGVIQYTTDEGSSWQVLLPVGDYVGTIDDDYSNPLGGLPAFSGYSLGWTGALVPLPAKDNVRIRFAFGTDVSNTETAEDFAGWMLSDIRLLSAPPASSAPAIELVSAPKSSFFIVGSPPAPATISVASDTWTSQTLSVCDVKSDELTYQTIAPLRMSTTQFGQYRMPWPLGSSASVGDEAFCQIRVIDASGAAWTSPESFNLRQTALVGTYQTLEAAAVPRGLWKETATGFSLEGTLADPKDATIIIGPVLIPRNSTQLRLELAQSFSLAPSAAGAVRYSFDGGTTFAFADLTGSTDTYTDGTREIMTAWLDSSRSDVDFASIPVEGDEVLIHIQGLAATSEQTSSWDITALRLLAASAERAFEWNASVQVGAPYPNPTRDELVLPVTTVAADALSIDVFDALGRRVIDHHVGLQRGATTIRLRTGQLASGPYTIRLTTEDGKVFHHPFVVLR